MRAICVGIAFVLASCALVVGYVKPSAAALDDVRVRGWTNARKPQIDQPVGVTIQLRNLGNDEVGPLDIEASPFQIVDRSALPGIVLKPKQSAEAQFSIVPSRKGPVDLLVRLHLPTTRESRTEKIDTVDVIETPWFPWVSRDVLGSAVPLTVAVVSALVTIGVQLHVLRMTRQQKSGEAMAAVVMNQGRDYYATMSGALGALRRALGRIPTAPAAEREHLSRRCFFFLGIFFHNEHLFAFRQGYMYLPHLWAEQIVVDVIREVHELVGLSQADEAVLHKCFSDMARLEQRGEKDDGTIVFHVRTLYDLERLLEADINVMTPAAERVLREAYDRIRPLFVDEHFVRRLAEVDQLVRAVIEYEFTDMFREWYARGGLGREVPSTPPADFEGIAGSTAEWDVVLKSLNRTQGGWLERRGS